MNAKVAASIRYWVLFWIFGPVTVTSILMLLIVVGGYVAGPNAQGVLARFAFAAGFFAMLAPVITAHIITVAAVVGIVSVVVGLRPDWKLLVAILVGLAVGAVILFRLYFAPSVV
ncbi:hypothetical protein [Pelomonas aquatica]|jgi:hypothetical protein|uniref:Uncharacterized protein n=1 Tax=Pelomonas aquatica TaxID=431058 RepID=A0A9X4LMA1_9BURK|nr:hypothetical protein [Pelomonas aquatica]MCY4757406.1 hypothetical protein [Pelomonas aquatica]MDG0865434.1 hypothetical protein [Pelomonas aquatica]